MVCGCADASTLAAWGTCRTILSRDPGNSEIDAAYPRERRRDRSRHAAPDLMRNYVPHRPIILHSHVQVHRRDANMTVPGRVSNLGQRAPPHQRVADEGVAAVVDGYSPRPFMTQRPTRPLETQPQGMPGEFLAVAVGKDGTNEQIVTLGVLPLPCRFPGHQVVQFASIPPERHGASLTPLANIRSDANMRPIHANPDVVQAQGRDLRDPKPAATGQAHDHEAQPRIDRLARCR